MKRNTQTQVITATLTIILLITAFLPGPALPETAAFFSSRCDLRYAWLDNDAVWIDDADSLALELADLICMNRPFSTINCDIDICTRGFGASMFNELLTNWPSAACEPRPDDRIRIIGDRAFRNEAGFFIAQGYGFEVADNNLPALVYRVNFQRDPSVGVDGWLTDRGEEFAVHDADIAYGWEKDRSDQTRSSGNYPSPLVDDYFRLRNNLEVPLTHADDDSLLDGLPCWEIEIENGVYYVFLAVGSYGEDTVNFIRAEGEDIFPEEAGWTDRLEAGYDGSYNGSKVVGGYDEEAGRYRSRRIEVTDGRLTLELGPETIEEWEASTTALCYLEIYRADPENEGGDPGEDRFQVQAEGEQRASFVIFHSGTGHSSLLLNTFSAPHDWAGSSVFTTGPEICALFHDQFEMMWGSGGTVPRPDRSRFGQFKAPLWESDITVDEYPWQVIFAPSLESTYDIFRALEEFLNRGHSNLILLLERFDDETGPHPYYGPGRLLRETIPALLDRARFELYGLITSPHDDPVYRLDDHPGAEVAFGFSDYNNLALLDALDDTRRSGRGKVLTGSNRWTEAGFYLNDGQEVIIEDPYLANKFLQYAMGRLSRAGIDPPARTADVILALDRSSSLLFGMPDSSGTRLEAVKGSANLFIDLINPDHGHRLGLIEFDRESEVARELESLGEDNRAAYHTTIDELEVNLATGGGTNQGLPLVDSRSQLRAPGGNPRQIIHLFTDGREDWFFGEGDMEPLPTAESIYRGLADEGVEIHTTGFGPDIDSDLLARMADYSGGSFAQVPLEREELEKRFIEVARQAMDWDYLLDPQYWISEKYPTEERIWLSGTARRLKFILRWEDRYPKAAAMEITAPDGTLIGPKLKGFRRTAGNGYQIIHLDPKLMAGIDREGEWKVRVSAGPGFPGGWMEVSLDVLGDTDLDFRAEVIDDGQYPGQIRLLCRTLDSRDRKNIEPATGGYAYARWSRPSAVNVPNFQPEWIPLFDDGLHRDGEAGDGLYGADIYLDEPGSHRFHFISWTTVPGEQTSFIYPRREARVSYQVPGTLSKYEKTGIQLPIPRENSK